MHIIRDDPAASSAEKEKIRRIKSLIQHLNRGEPISEFARIDAAVEAFRESPLYLLRYLDQVIESFCKAGKADVLLDALLFSSQSAAFNSVSLVDKVAVFAKSIGRLAEFRARLLMAHDPTSTIRYPEILKDTASMQDDELRDLLFDFKYAGLDDVGNIDKLMENAARLKTRIRFDEAATAPLFSHRRSKVGRPEWENELLTSFAIDLLTRDVPFGPSLYHKMIDNDATNSAVSQFYSEKAAVIFVGHLGFGVARVILTAKIWPRSINLGSRNTPLFINLSEGLNSALFAGLNALRENKAVVVAPDGPMGNVNVTISVLGRPTDIGGGGAVLAYESRCPTYWMNVGRQGDRFIPAVVPGPVRTGAETYKQYLARWAEFYEAMLNDYLTSDPQNLALTLRWIRFFSGLSPKP